MTDFDPNTFAIAGVFVIGLLIGLTQVLREVFRIPPRFLPIIPVLVALLLIALNEYVPAIARLVVVALAVGLAAAMTVSFAKRGDGRG